MPSSKYVNILDLIRKDPGMQELGRNIKSIGRAAANIPAEVAGSAVDTSNLVMGLLSGKGLGGFTKTPIGGSESIKKVVGSNPMPLDTPELVASLVFGLATGRPNPRVFEFLGAKHIPEALDKLDQMKVYDTELQAPTVIRNAAAMAKELNINERLRKDPSTKTVDAIIQDLVTLPSYNNRATALTVKEVLSNYVLPAKRRIEYAELSPEEVAKNLKERGITKETGELQEDVLRVIRGQPTAREKIRTPLEIEKYSARNPKLIPNQMAYSTVVPEEANKYSASGTLPVSYPMYLKNSNLFDMGQPEHREKLIKAVEQVAPEFDQGREVVDDLGWALESYARSGYRSWDFVERPVVQAALKKAGFKGVITDEAGPATNYGVFDPSEFLSIFSHGKPGTSDIQSQILTALGLGGAGLIASSVEEETKKKID